MLTGNGDGSFNTASTSQSATPPIALGRGDFNGDGGIDLVAANAGDDDVSVLLNQP